MEFNIVPFVSMGEYRLGMSIPEIEQMMKNGYSESNDEYGMNIIDSKTGIGFAFADGVVVNIICLSPSKAFYNDLDLFNLTRIELMEELGQKSEAYLDEDGGILFTEYGIEVTYLSEDEGALPFCVQIHSREYTFKDLDQYEKVTLE